MTMCRKQFPQLAALLAAVAFNLFAAGCGASDSDKDKALEEQAAQLNSCSDRLRMSNGKIVDMQSTIDQCVADKTALQSKVDKAAMTQQTAMLEMFTAQDTRTWRCTGEDNAVADGTFGNPQFNDKGKLVVGFTEVKTSTVSMWCNYPRLVDLIQTGGFKCHVTSYTFTCAPKA